MYTDKRCFEMNEAMPMKEEMKYEKAMAMPMNMGMNYSMGNSCCPMPGMECPPVMECPQERCCHREIIHHVPHVQQVNTRIINHHIYKHTFTPCFTCCEENVCSNVYENPCCGC